MTKKYNRMAVLAKVEGTYGTDATPTGALNAILLKDVTINPMNADQIKRDLITDALGNKGSSLAGLHSTMEFSVELASSGAAGTVPGWGVLMRGCALSETINAATSVVYQTVSAGDESLTLYMYMDGTLHKMTGAKGTVSIEITAKQIPYLKFSFIGLFVDPTETAMPTQVLNGWQVPITVSNANTPTLDLHSYSAVTQSITLNLANQNIHRDLINGAGVKFVDRESAGSIKIEAPDLTTIDFWDKAKKSTTGPLQLIHGLIAGEIIQIDAPKVQVLNPGYEDQDGTLMLNMNLDLLPDAGNDELVITVK